uniref:DUF5131 family protein n=1 Tax=Pelagimonas sp. TaxID=2073170 RepID=UPI003D6B8A6B
RERGRWPRVFLSSLCVVFDNAAAPDWRIDLFRAIEAAPNCRFQMLTKRVGNVFQMIPPAWANGGWPSHVGLMITVVNQEEANRDIPKLLDLKARLGIPWVGLSIEPMLGPIQLGLISIGRGNYPSRRVVSDTIEPLNGKKVIGTATGYDFQPYPKIDWVICGGESGPKARPMHPDWARSLRDQCWEAETPFLFKQWGEWTDNETMGIDGNEQLRALYKIQSGETDKIHTFDDNVQMYRLGKKVAGRLLDGDEHNGFPEALT